jgi:hypothetical protein
VPVFNNNTTLKPTASKAEYKWSRKKKELSGDAGVFVKYKPGRQYILTVKTECTTLTVTHEVQKVAKIKPKKIKKVFYRQIPKFQVELAMGINNKSGYLGLGADYNVTNIISFGAGIGLSTWGNSDNAYFEAFKEYAELKIFTKKSHKGIALGLGSTYNNGSKGVGENLMTVRGFTEQVYIDYLPQWNLFGCLYYYRELAHYSIGYSYRMYESTIIQTYGNKVVQSEIDSINSVVPKGIVFTIAWVFGHSN